MTAGPAGRVLVVLSLVLAGCGVAHRTADPAPGVTARGSALHWSGCDHGFQCARVRVPLDEEHPGRASITLGLVRLRATGARIGALFVNPGGPGASAVQYVEGVAESFPAAVRQRFDIVGVDPRGVGRSTPLQCDRYAAAMYRADPSIDHPADRVLLLDRSRTFVRDCARVAGHLLPHLGTLDGAGDLDRVRRAMGDEQLSFLGFSYGSVLGQVYAARFPTRVRAMVLDGVVDPARSGLAGARTQAAGFEHALGAFAADCRRDPSCPIHADPLAAVDRVSAQAERRPIPSSGGARPAGPAEVTLALVQSLYDEAGWPDLAGAVAAAAAGDGAQLVDLADQYVRAVPIAPYFAVSCLDARWPDVDGVLRGAAAAGRTYPHFGAAITVDYVRCSLWPTPAQPLAVPAGKANTPVVLVSTTGDPATPYAEGAAVARRFRGSRVITHLGDGHTITFHGDPCIDGAVTSFLVDLHQPKRSLRCG